jgi:endonuclease YncB( thermonuclease family)
MARISSLQSVAMMAIPSALALAGCDPGKAQPTSGVGHEALSEAKAARPSLAGADTFSCTVASITDGDIFRCAETEANGKQIRVRLSGVAAREKDGSCTAGHPCPDAAPEAATAALDGLAGGKALVCRQVGTTYARRSAFCSLPSGEDLSCSMVASGTVAKWDRYWGDHRC